MDSQVCKHARESDLLSTSAIITTAKWTKRRLLRRVMAYKYVGLLTYGTSILPAVSPACAVALPFAGVWLSRCHTRRWIALVSILRELLTVRLQHLEARFAQPLAVTLQAGQYPERVGKGVAAEPSGVRAAGGLLLRSALKKAARLHRCWRALG
jgi:hypothetical protein